VLIVLDVKKEGYWTPIAEEYVIVLPNFYAEVSEARKAAALVEQKAQTDGDYGLLQSAWAVLAYAEDLLERAKFAEKRCDFTLTQRLKALKGKVSKIQQGIDPYADVRGYQLRGYRSALNREIQLYSLYVPKDYHAGISWPLVVMLHGAFSNHHLALRRVLGRSNRPGESDCDAKREMPSLPNVPYLVVCPNGFETLSYEGFAEEDVWRVMEEVEKRFCVDPDRVYMTGLSMGGAGTAKLAFRKPDKFAALAMVCGFYDSLTVDTDFFKKPLFARRLAEVGTSHPISDNILHVPIKLFHGEDDPIVPVEGSQKLHHRLSKIGFQTEIEVYPNVGHEAWEKAYADARIFDWFSQHVRVKNPREIRYKCGDAGGGGAYWLHVDELKEIRRYGTVYAYAREDEVFVDSKNVQCLTLTVPAAFYPEGKEITIRINKSVVYQGVMDGKPQSFIADGREWKQVSERAVSGVLPGRGGIYSVFEDRQVYVYGMSGTEESNLESRKLAVRRAIPWAWADVRWDVIPESNLTEAMHGQYNQIHFGTLKSSKFIKDHIDFFPFTVQDQGLILADRRIEPDQALTFIYPNPVNPNRYVLINTAMSFDGLKGLQTKRYGAVCLISTGTLK